MTGPIFLGGIRFEGTLTSARVGVRTTEPLDIAQETWIPLLYDQQMFNRTHLGSIADLLLCFEVLRLSKSTHCYSITLSGCKWRIFSTHYVKNLDGSWVFYKSESLWKLFNEEGKLPAHLPDKNFPIFIDSLCYIHWKI